MADPRRQDDDEPLTQLDVDIDKQQLDSLIERDATTSPGGVGPETHAGGADDEPQTMEPPRVMGVPRLRAHTMLGVAPPSSGANAPPTTQPDISSIPKIHFEGEESQEQTETKPGEIPKIAVEGDDEQTTMVGKLLAEAHAQVAKRLKGSESDLYADETATTVGDAEKLIAAANAAAFGTGPRTETDEVDEPTESRSARDALMEDTTSRRDAIDVESALARAAELRAEAERKKKQAKKRTIHGLGDGPLKLPARPREEEIPTNENKLPETGERPASTRSSNKLVVAPPIPLDSAPADGEMETLSAGVPQAAPMRKINTEPETLQVQVPSSRGRLPTAPADPALTLGSATPAEIPFAGPPGPSMQQTLNLGANASPYTQPMPYAPTVRMEEGAPPGMDRALRATMNSPMHQPVAPITGPLPATPTGGVPHYHSTPMPVAAPQYSMQPNAAPAAFARTAVQTGSGPAVVEAPKKKSGGGLIFFLVLIVSLGGLGYWQRAILKAAWDQYRNPAPVATTPPDPSADPSAAPSVTPSASAALTPPPVATESAAPQASGSAAPQGSSSAAPHASSSATPRASASSSPTTKPPTKKPAPWRPPPKKPTGGTSVPKPMPKPVPKPIDENRGF